MFRGIIKIILWVTLVTFLIGSIYFSGLLESISLLVIDINHEFIAYLPRQLRAILSIVVFGLALQVYYKFKR